MKARILAIHAHPDDIEILAGGTMALLAAAGHNITTKTFPGVGHSLLKMQGTTILGYADGYLDFIVAWGDDHVQKK